MKKFILLVSLLVTATIACTVYNVYACQQGQSKQPSVTPPWYEAVPVSKDTKIQVAILLDTSSSMDGLIEQAKSRLWNIVNTLTTLKYKGRTPQIEIALYEYGNNGINSNDWIRRVTPLTTDLDLISEKLFSLTTWGGEELCGAVIDKAIRQLDWGNSPADMKLIYIAGNEPFNQGEISYKDAINRALERNIYVNTIHCGSSQAGIQGFWRDGAIRGKGKFFNIDHNARVQYVDTPYDDRIALCNEKLNATYISYGAMGSVKKQSQAREDQNARSISAANMAERAVSKSTAVYNNAAWDLVDLVQEDEAALETIAQAELPAEMRDKSKDEIKALVTQKESERKQLQQEINELAKRRQTYIEQKAKESSTTGDDLGKAITESIIALATLNGYEVAK